MPDKNLSDMREIVHIMDQTTRKIFEEKFAKDAQPETKALEGGAKDLMSILRACLSPLHYVHTP